MLMTEMYNHSTHRNDGTFQKHLREKIIKLLIDFLGETLVFISSIIQCEHCYSYYQLIATHLMMFLKVMSPYIDCCSFNLLKI